MLLKLLLSSFETRYSVFIGASSGRNLKIPTHKAAKKTENKIGPENFINNSRLLIFFFELIISSPKLYPLLIPDKTAGSQFPKIKLWKGEEMKTVLSDYLGNPIPPTSNAFGQEYSFITARNGDMIEALVVASGGGVDELVLNGIGQYLFDKGAVLASDGVLLSDLSLSQTLLNEAKKMVSPTLGGALLMFVNDAFFSSDFSEAFFSVFTFLYSKYIIYYFS